MIFTIDMFHGIKIMIAFGPPHYAPGLDDIWETYFKDDVLPKLEECNWIQEKSGWGWLECENKKFAAKILCNCGWREGTNYWGGVRFDPALQEPPKRDHATKSKNEPRITSEREMKTACHASKSALHR